MFNNPKKYANENALLKEQIQDLAAEIEAVSIANKNMCDTNSNPEEMYQTVKRKSVNQES